MRKMAPKCTINGCEKLAQKRGHCSAHYQSERASGRLQRINGDDCAVDGCEVMAVCRGLCDKHYRRVLQHGDPITSLRRPVKRTETHKECVTCREFLPYEAFNKASKSKDGRQGQCRNCAKLANRGWYDKNRTKAREDAKRWNRENPNAQASSHYRKRYGITYDEYQAMVESQGGRCAICLKEPAPEGNRRGLFVDHNHYTGKVRELLCRQCNSGLGNFKEDPALLSAAAKYLARHRAG